MQFALLCRRPNRLPQQFPWPEDILLIDGRCSLPASLGCGARKELAMAHALSGSVGEEVHVLIILCEQPYSGIIHVIERNQIFSQQPVGETVILPLWCKYSIRSRLIADP